MTDGQDVPRLTTLRLFQGNEQSPSGKVRVADQSEITPSMDSNAFIRDQRGNSRRKSHYRQVRNTEESLSELRAIFESNLTNPPSSELLWRHARWIAGVTEKAVEASRHHNPE
jgi:hypothetical protein